MSDEKVLTKEIAEQFLLGEGTINQYQTIDSPETAKLLATAECDLEFEGLTRLDLDIAAELIQHTGGDLWLDGLLELPLDLAQVLSKHVGRITFDSVADLDVESATAIAQKKGALGFGGICNLTHLVARALCEGQIEQLELTGLTELSDAAAESLSKHKGNLGLNRLTTLSDAAALSLSKYEGNLVLKGLTELTDVAAENLGKHAGGFLLLTGLTELSDAAAKSLSKHEGGLDLSGLTELSDVASDSLSKHEGDLYLNGLAELTDVAAKKLSKHKGGLVLIGLTELTDVAAESLSKHKVWWLSLSGLTSLSDAAAESLSKHERDLYLNGLTKLSDAAAESLCKHEGQIELDGLTQLSDAAAESLSKHNGNLCLNGLTELSDVASENLSKHAGGFLLLNGLTKLSDAGAESLGKHHVQIELDGLTESAAEIFQRYSSTLTLTKARRFSSDEYAVTLENFTFIDDEAAIFLSGQPSRTLDLTGLKSISLKSVNNLVINHELIVNTEHLTAEIIKALDEGNRSRLDKKEKRDATAGRWMFGELSGPTFQLICGCCPEETIEELWDIAGGTAYEDTDFRAEELGWSVSSSWQYDHVIRCPQCTVKDACPNCGETELIAIRGEETPICMECESERLAKTLGIEV